ncbi:E3 ubiquitin-protein ligase RNF181 [Drosophila sechellia]|uniref:GM17193 n=1 Tax=Drosophila sechellia TaxID=7238 RepID=B4I528_DROSE|nr:E3 ubiquitin-protein ligase RNF181 [Drosophila sechellia]EDW55484.1 GM17193 [Drosophila sechellia]
MDKQDIKKMTKKKLIFEVIKERKRNKEKDKIIHDRLEPKKRLHDLRLQLDKEKNITKELRLKLSDQDAIAHQAQNLSMKLQKIAKENKCYICKLKYEVTGGHRAVSIKCGHLFGEKCILDHLKRSKACPICKSLTSYTDVRFIIAGQNLCTAELLN